LRQWRDPRCRPDFDWLTLPNLKDHHGGRADERHGAVLLIPRQWQTCVSRSEDRLSCRRIPFFRLDLSPI
jgi:hypothetical protein